MVPTAGRSCPTHSPSSAGGPLRSSPDPRMPVRSRSNQDVGSLNERLHGSTAADASPKISRKPSRVPRRVCCSPAFAYFLDVWQGPEIMGINIESDSKGERNFAAVHESACPLLSAVWQQASWSILSFG